MNNLRNDWKPIPDHDGYEISINGEIRSYRTPGRKTEQRGAVHPIAPKRRKDGYLAVILSVDGVLCTHLIHRLMLETFTGKPLHNHQARHLNGIRDDNRLINLRWGTGSENSADSRKHGTLSQGEHRYNSKLKTSDIHDIRASTESSEALGQRYGVSRSLISGIKRGRRWKHVKQQQQSERS